MDAKVEAPRGTVERRQHSRRAVEVRPHDIGGDQPGVGCVPIRLYFLRAAGSVPANRARGVSIPLPRSQSSVLRQVSLHWRRYPPGSDHNRIPKAVCGRPARGCHGGCHLARLHRPDQLKRPFQAVPERFVC
jgi:hypothetical protein